MININVQMPVRRIYSTYQITPPIYLYSLSLHDALPIFDPLTGVDLKRFGEVLGDPSILKLFHGGDYDLRILDRKSTRLNSSHLVISYAVFCLKKKNTK